MPFIEIKKEDEDWIKIDENGFSIPKKLREHLPNKVRLFYDVETRLIGLKNSEEGYKFYEERFTCRKMPEETYGKYEAYWDENRGMVIADLSKNMEK